MAVAIVEKAELPRYKTCGGGIVGRTMQALPIDVRHVVEQDCHAAQLTLHPDGLSFTAHRQTPIVAMTMRSRFDFAIVSAAQEAGAAVRSRHAVEHVSCRGDCVDVHTNGGALRAKFLVAADGAFSTVARSLGMEDGRVLIPALEYEVTLPPRRLAGFHGKARFDFGWLPHGYAWAFPKREHLSIGVLSMARRGRDLKHAIERYLDALGCREARQVERHGSVIPMSPRRGPVVDTRILLVGDAAGLTDPVTGEGISFAVRSGLLAAQSLIDMRLDEEAVCGSYVQSLRDTILPELRAGRVLARLLYRWPRIRSWAFSRQGQRLCEAVTDVMTGTRRYRDVALSSRAVARLLMPKRVTDRR
jgi:geranylgeranyl reductase family protein